MTQVKTKQKPVVEFAALDGKIDQLLYRGQVIGMVGDKTIQLDIRELSLVKQGWARKRTIMLYRALPRIYRYLKSQGYVVYGGVWFPNLEKETLGAFYDDAVALNAAGYGAQNATQETAGEESLERES